MSLINAIEAGDIAEVQRLLDEGADPNCQDEWGDRALIVATTEGLLPAVDLLLKHGADATHVDDDGATVLHTGPRHPELLELLIEAGAPVNRQDDAGLTALYLMVREPALVRVLIEHGADPNLATKNHETPLTFCAAWDHAESAKLIIEAGGDVNYIDPETGLSVLGYAAEAGHQAMTELLLDNGADPDGGADLDRSPLAQALRREHLDAALLIAPRAGAETRRALTALSATLQAKVERLMRALHR